MNAKWLEHLCIQALMLILLMDVNKFIHVNIILIACFKKDDLESLLYVLVYLHKGGLPWQKVIDKNQTDYRELMEMKLSITASVLFCDMPKDFITIYDHITNLKSSDEPDY